MRVRNSVEQSYLHKRPTSSSTTSSSEGEVGEVNTDNISPVDDEVNTCRRVGKFFVEVING